MDTDFVRELFASFRPVEVRNMFGGTGIAVDGITFAIAFSGVIFLKADDEIIPVFQREGSKPFVYPLGKTPRLRKKPSTFWRLPERLYDDPDELAVWAERSLAIAQRKKIVGKTRKPATKKSPVKKRKTVAKKIINRNRLSRNRRKTKS